MIRWFLRRKLNAEEKKLGVSVDYLRHVLDISPALMIRFASLMPFMNSRKALPKETWFAAQIVTLQHEDCGPCLQIGVNLARKDRVDPALLRALLAGADHELSSEMLDVVHFTRSVLTATGDDELRETMRKRYGERGLVELSYAIAGSRIPPTVKRCLGYAKSCSVEPVEVRA